MKPIDILGLKNFRIFNGRDGFFEKLASINLITGANNSGKSSIIKALQLLKNSVRENYLPFYLDLSRQEHLLGDFDNIFNSSADRNIVIELPFPFLGFRNFYISLTFQVLQAKPYEGKLRKMEVIDRNDGIHLFKFSYQQASDLEKEDYERNYREKNAQYHEGKEGSDHPYAIFDDHINFASNWKSYNPLVGFIQWYANRDKLNKHLAILRQFYLTFLNRPNIKTWLQDSDLLADQCNLALVPSISIDVLGHEVNIERWEKYLNNLPTTPREDRYHIGEDDFIRNDEGYPEPEIEDILFHGASRILFDEFKWSPKENININYIQKAFDDCWKVLAKRIGTINYIANVREENARSYHAGTNSPFIILLKAYYYSEYGNRHFLNKYLRKFDIGDQLEVQYNFKYQSLSVFILSKDQDNPQLAPLKRELVDYGYGIKQLVQILLQISVLAQNNKNREPEFDDYGDEKINIYYDPSLLIIEEPETNLHPKWQSVLAEMFLEAMKKYNIQFIIETHSEYLIRRFQTLVADKAMNATDIAVFYLRNPQKISPDRKQVECLQVGVDGSLDYKKFDGGFVDVSDGLELNLLNIQRKNFLQEFHETKARETTDKTKITTLQKQIDDYLEKVDLSVYQGIIANRFNISKLDAFTTHCLVSGQFLFNVNDQNADYSPIIMQYGRAVENELEKFFDKLCKPNERNFGIMQNSMLRFIKPSTPLLSGNKMSDKAVEQKLLTWFNNPSNLKIKQIRNIREIRNQSAHIGTTKSKQDAEDYINTVDEFLDFWLKEKK